MKKHYIWSNTTEEIEAIAHDMVANGEYESIDEAWLSACDLVNDYLDDEIINLSDVRGRVIGIGAFCSWNGLSTGYRIFDSLADVLRQDMTEDIIELYVDTDGHLHKHGIHHDGSNDVVYYLLPYDLDETDIARDDDDRIIIEQECHLDSKGYVHSTGVSIFDVVESLAPQIASVYGWTA